MQCAACCWASHLHLMWRPNPPRVPTFAEMADPSAMTTAMDTSDTGPREVCDAFQLCSHDVPLWTPATHVYMQVVASSTVIIPMEMEAAETGLDVRATLCSRMRATPHGAVHLQQDHSLSAGRVV